MHRKLVTQVLWNFRGLSGRRITAIIGAAYLHQPLALFLTEDWPRWIGRMDGIGAWVAGLISSSACLWLLFYLRNKVDKALAQIQVDQLQSELSGTIARIESSRLDLLVGSFASVIGGVIVFLFWVTGIVPYKSLIWLVGCIVSVTVAALLATALILYVAWITRAIIISKNLMHAIEPRRGAQSYPTRVLFDLTTQAISFPILGLAIWTYVFIFFRSFEHEEGLLTLILSGFVFTIVGGAFFTVTWKLHIAMKKAKVEFLNQLGRELYMTAAERLDAGKISEDQLRRLEVLDILKRNAQNLPEWPVTLIGTTSVIGSLIITLGPQTLLSVLRLLLNKNTE